MAFNGDPPESIKPKKNGWKIVLIVVVLLAAAGFGISKILLKFDNLMRGTYAYTEGVRLMSENGAAKTILGTPIEVGKTLSGNVNLHNFDRVATYSLAVKGENCAGVYHIRAERSMGMWDIYLMVLESECADSPLILHNSRNILFLEETAEEA